MFTTIDKALIAAIGGIVAIGDLVFGFNFGIDEGQIAATVAVFTPIIVWLFPNKEA